MCNRGDNAAMTPMTHDPQSNHGFSGTATSVETLPILARDSCTRTKRIVAIVGYASSSRDLANQQPPDVEIWALSDAYTFLRRASRWFEVHDYNNDEGAAAWQTKMREIGVPVFCLFPLAGVPNSFPLPYAEICEALGVDAYFTSTIAYMLAMAVYESVKEIRLFGIDMATGTEYEGQRACCEYWIGVARAKGIKVVIPDSSPLCKAPLYGFGFNGSVSRRVLLDQLATLKRQEQAALEQYQCVQGGIQATMRLIKDFHLQDVSYTDIALAGVDVGETKVLKKP